MWRSRKQLDTIDRRTELIEAILLVRDPGSSMAAQAFDGLRRAVIDARQARQTHLVHLAQIDTAVQRGATNADLKLLLRDLLAETGVVRLVDPSNVGAFDVSGVGPNLTVTAPAYVDGATGTVIVQGQARAEADTPSRTVAAAATVTTDEES